MTATDRGTERRRLLAAVRSDGEEAATEDGDSNTPRGDHPEPAPDGGAITLDGPLFHCSRCDRAYLEEPASCDSCGEPTFDRRTA
ncbi:hypothetical protein [Salinarchaeum chitinilyticum]